MFKRFLGILLIGLVIKIMDDYLDQDLDHLLEKKNFADLLGKGILPYTLLLSILALGFNFSEGLSFFLASYILGMAFTGSTLLPSKLKAWQEGIIAFAFSLYFSSWYDTIGAIILITLLQFFDDFWDYRQEKYLKRNNYIHRLGYLNSFLIFIALFLLAVKYYPFKLIYFSLASLLIYLFTYYLSSRILRSDLP